MQSPYSEFGIGAVDQDRDLDLGRRDGLDIDGLLRKRLERASAATPAWLRMPMPITDTLASPDSLCTAS
jgi:hypothetical protein